MRLKVGIHKDVILMGDPYYTKFDGKYQKNKIKKRVKYVFGPLTFSENWN